MKQRVRPWGLALVGSLLVHACLFAGLTWELPQGSSPIATPPIEMRLIAVAKPLAAPPPVAPTPQPRQAVRPTPRPPVTPVPESAAASAAEPKIEPAVASPVPEAAAAAEPVAHPEPAPTPPAAPAPPPLNPLPPRLDLRYRLSYGVASGEQTLVWVNEGEHYTLTSVATASGLAGIFYRGQFVQTSRGRIAPTGLQPEEFWDQRGSKHSRATFDVAQGLLVLTPDKGAARHFSYQGEVQDVLSLFFQFALTAPPSGGQLTYNVFNGKKLRTYRYDVQGEVLLDTRLGALRTLRLTRAGSGDGQFEIWLAIDRHYLPVRVRRSDEAGEMELSILSITP